MNHTQRRRLNPPKDHNRFVDVSPNNRSKRARRKIRAKILGLYDKVDQEVWEINTFGRLHL